jgi:AcrR family transcriptional regulator
VTATGLDRSSLYATFGGKQELYLAALRRYLEQRGDGDRRTVLARQPDARLTRCPGSAGRPVRSHSPR